jgi:hypothetical protein
MTENAEVNSYLDILENPPLLPVEFVRFAYLLKERLPGKPSKGPMKRF